MRLIGNKPAAPAVEAAPGPSTTPPTVPAPRAARDAAKPATGAIPAPPARRGGVPVPAAPRSGVPVPPAPRGVVPVAPAPRSAVRARPAAPAAVWWPPDRATRRLVQLIAGLFLYGLSMALMIRSRLGLDPWDVFHQGVAYRTGLSFGVVVILTGVAVLLGWIPLRQRPGIGTVLNAVLIGVAVEVFLAVLPAPPAMPLRIGFLVAGVVLNGVATGAYIGARLGPGPRDGLMTGYSSRYGASIRLVRTVIEVTVLATGWLLGGRVGVGTVLYAVAIGPLAHVFIPLLTVRPSAHRAGPRSG